LGLAREHRAALLAVPKSGEGPIVNLKPEIELVKEPTGPSYYTQVKKADGKIIGYRLNTVTMRAENTWRINLDADQEITSVEAQYQTVSTATKTKSILPTVFGLEGDLFYKFLDANMFSVITRSKNDPTELTFYLINGVTGRITHQFKQFNVSTNAQHSVCQLFTEQYYVFSTMKKSGQGADFHWQELAVVELYSKKKVDNTW